jgi:hypothetical protein
LRRKRALRPGGRQRLSRRADAAAFEVHAELPRTGRFAARAGRLIDHPLDVMQAKVIG